MEMKVILFPEIIAIKGLERRKNANILKLMAVTISDFQNSAKNHSNIIEFNKYIFGQQCVIL